MEGLHHLYIFSYFFLNFSLIISHTPFIVCVCVLFLWWRRVTLRKLKQGGLLFTTTDGKCERIHKAWRQLPFLPLWGMLTSTKSAVGITRQFSCH